MNCPLPTDPSLPGAPILQKGDNSAAANSSDWQ
jgi:hypothetical protein